MQDTNSAGSVSAHTAVWLTDALAIAEQEIIRIYKLGYVPFSLDRSDLASDLNQLVAEMMLLAELPDPALLRIAMRRNLLDMIRDEYGRNNKTWPVELRGGEGLLDGIAFDQCLNRLSAKQQDAVYLLYVDGLTEAAAAQQLGISRDSLRDRVRAAVSQLKNFLAVTP